MNKDSLIFITGHRGLLGSNLLNFLKNKGYSNILVASRDQLDLLNQNDVEIFLKSHQPEYIFHCAAKAGGIMGNKASPYDFIYNNLQIQNNIINTSYASGVKKLLFVSSTCVYPKNCPQPMKETDILSSKFTKDLQPYCLAKVAGAEMLEALYSQFNFASNTVLLPNLYGPGDHYGDDSNHVIPALIERFYNAKMNNLPEVIVWGNGSAIREFLYIDDASSGLLELMLNYDEVLPINLSSQDSLTIKELTEIISEEIKFSGKIIWDESKPEGAPIKKSDNTLVSSTNWKPKTKIIDGIRKTIHDFESRYVSMN